MGIYENIGVKPIINLAGPVTRFGGALMRSEVVEAMCEAARESVRLDELEAAASKVIAEITGAEAGYVTSGAAASMTLGTAACLTGLDVARMNRLPDTSGMPNEVLMSHHQISGYTRSVQAAGAKLVAVGIPKRLLRFPLLRTFANSPPWGLIWLPSAVAKELEVHKIAVSCVGVAI